MNKQIYHVVNRSTAQIIGLYVGENKTEVKRLVAAESSTSLEDMSEDILFDWLGRLEDFELCIEIVNGDRSNPLSELLDGIGPHHGQHIPDRLIRGLIEIEEEARGGCVFAEEALEDINQLHSDWSDSGYPEIVENWIRNKEVEKWLQTKKVASYNKTVAEKRRRTQEENLIAIAEDLETTARSLKQLIKAGLLI